MDPHSVETLEEGLSNRHFDLVVAIYGRLRAIATAVRALTHRLIAVSGQTVYRGVLAPDRNVTTRTGAAGA